MVYPHNSETDKPEIINDTTNLDTASRNNWISNSLIYGDCIRETSTSGNNNTSWVNEASSFVGLYSPFTLRGGHFYGASSAGLFAFNRSYGYSGYYDGFRATIIVA